MICGDHLFARTAQTFAYLQRRLVECSLTLPAGSLGLASFGPGQEVPA